MGTCVCSKCKNSFDSKLVKFDRQLKPCCPDCIPTFQEMLDTKEEVKKMDEQPELKSAKEKYEFHADKVLEYLNSTELNDVQKRKVNHYVYQKLTEKIKGVK